MRSESNRCVCACNSNRRKCPLQPAPRGATESITLMRGEKPSSFESRHRFGAGRHSLVRRPLQLSQLSQSCEFGLPKRHCTRIEWAERRARSLRRRLRQQWVDASQLSAARSHRLRVGSCCRARSMKHSWSRSTAHDCAWRHAGSPSTVVVIRASQPQKDSSAADGESERGAIGLSRTSDLRAAVLNIQRFGEKPGLRAGANRRAEQRSIGPRRQRLPPCLPLSLCARPRVCGRVCGDLLASLASCRMLRGQSPSQPPQRISAAYEPTDTAQGEKGGTVGEEEEEEQGGTGEGDDIETKTTGGGAVHSRRLCSHASRIPRPRPFPPCSSCDFIEIGRCLYAGVVRRRHARRGAHRRDAWARGTRASCIELK